MRTSHPGLARLSAAIDVVQQHGQLAALERRVREEHPWGKANMEKEYDARLRDCLTEACALAWADLRGLGKPQFDYRPGMPDVHVPPNLWVEAKAIHESAASSAVTDALLGGGCYVGNVSPPDQGRSLAFGDKLRDAIKKFQRLGRGRAIVFFNLTSVDIDQLVKQEDVLARYGGMLDRAEAACSPVSLVLCHAYDWQHPVRDPFVAKPAG